MRTEFYTADRFFSHPLTKAGSLGRSVFGGVAGMAMSFCCQRRQRYRLEHAERYQAPRRFEPCSPNQSTRARTRSEGPRRAGTRQKSHSHGRGERSPPCLFPSRKLKSGNLGGAGGGAPRREKNKRKRLPTKTIQRLNLISTSA